MVDIVMATRRWRRAVVEGQACTVVPTTQFLDKRLVSKGCERTFQRKSYDLLVAVDAFFTPISLKFGMVELGK